LHEGTVNALPAGGYFIQYDAQTEPGNSGGPLFDVETAVVYGIVVAKLRSSNESNVAIAANRLSAFLQNAHVALRASAPARGIARHTQVADLATPKPSPTPEPTPVIATEQCLAALAALGSAMTDLSSSYDRYTSAYATTTSATASATTRAGMIGAQIRVNLELRAIRSTVNAEEPKLVQPEQGIEQSGAIQTARRTSQIVLLIHQRDGYALAMSSQRKSLIDNLAAGGPGFTVDTTAISEANRLTNQVDSELSELRLSSPCNVDSRDPPTHS
jgi:hypothetical protein